MWGVNSIKYQKFIENYYMHQLCITIAQMMIQFHYKSQLKNHKPNNYKTPSKSLSY